jgi:hypothetical protein
VPARAPPVARAGPRPAGQRPAMFGPYHERRRPACGWAEAQLEGPRSAVSAVTVPPSRCRLGRARAESRSPGPESGQHRDRGRPPARFALMLADRRRDEGITSTVTQRTRSIIATRGSAVAAAAKHISMEPIVPFLMRLRSAPSSAAGVGFSSGPAVDSDIPKSAEETVPPWHANMFRWF